jgi:hypothetical protein
MYLQQLQQQQYKLISAQQLKLINQLHYERIEIYPGLS